MRHLRVPARLRIAGKRWTVAEADPGEMDEYKADGITFPAERRILLRAGMPRGYRDTVLTHELLHACWPWPRGIVTRKVEERLVTVLAPVVAGVLKQLRLERRPAKRGRR